MSAKEIRREKKVENQLIIKQISNERNVLLFMHVLNSQNPSKQLNVKILMHWFEWKMRNIYIQTASIHNKGLHEKQLEL